MPNLRSEAEYDAALAAIAMYFDREPTLGSPGAARFDQLALAISDYEAKHWPIDTPYRRLTPTREIINLPERS